MSSVVISGDTSGSITLAAPAVAGSNTITLPANTGTVITTASSGQVIPYAALPAGSVLQVVQTSYSVNVTNSSATYADTGVTAPITPKFATSKILVMFTIQGVIKKNGNTAIDFKLQKNNSDLIVYTTGVTGYNGTTTQQGIGSHSYNYLDSPASTSTLTYKVQFASTTGVATASVQESNGSAISTITLMEIAG